MINRKNGGALIMQMELLGKIIFGQDGAIFNGFLFRFDAKGVCSVYSLKDISGDTAPIARFTIDKSDKIVPHCNSVTFSNTYYNEGDEFPLLYSNIYNNYANADDKMKGVTCVYRLQRNENEFSATLVQVIEIGFTEDSLWKSESCEDVRPYGNCAIDRQNSVYYAFTMRDEEKTTRYFSFKLPSAHSGVPDEALGVPHAVLCRDDILDYFDCEYHKFVQGASFKDGILYSLEGFANDEQKPPAIRLIDTAAKKQKGVFYFSDFGLKDEPELIDFEGDDCYYSDGHGNFYKLTF